MIFTTTLAVPNITPLRKTIGSYLGQVLTPEMAAEIELAVSQVTKNTPETLALLRKWRGLIEPTVSYSITDMPWERVLETPVNVMEMANSVLVTTPPETRPSGKSVSVWVAAGKVDEVLQMFEVFKAKCNKEGINKIVFIGREGWLKVAGFKKMAVFGIKEI